MSSSVAPKLLVPPATAAEQLGVRESWLRKKAAARAIPCTFVGRHLRFSQDDLTEIVRMGSQPVNRRARAA